MMKDYLISMFIDDELDLDNKILFVETVSDDRPFKDETVDLLHQEKTIRLPVVDRVPPVTVRSKEKKWGFFWRPAGFFASGLAVAVLIVLLLLPSKQRLSAAHRFVIYQPGVKQVAITGSFTKWKAVAMNKTGNSGYWEITLDLPAGEHRYSFILEGNRQLADPTILTREKDDFGGENSVLEVTRQT
jgi:hypothetical protein